MQDSGKAERLRRKREETKGAESANSSLIAGSYGLSPAAIYRPRWRYDRLLKHFNHGGQHGFSIALVNQ